MTQSSCSSHNDTGTSITEAGADSAEILRALSPEFLERYNKQGPRYTSYPTAPEWKDTDIEGSFRRTIRADADGDSSAPLSLYCHIPFCEGRCRFCGCNVVISRRADVTERYLDSVEAEIGILAGELGGNGKQRPVTQVHLGGGTPTRLTPEQFTRLLGLLRANFHVQDGAELSLEANPLTTTDDQLETLVSLGFNRISYGVQDFDPKVQEAVGRSLPVELVGRVTAKAREFGFESVNYDLIYGLPCQTAETFKQTLETVTTLRPDRVAVYNFAFLPQRFKHQRAIPADQLPDGQEKFRIFVQTYASFLAAGYKYIGMDHYALEEDPLTQALARRTLQRNFMGYTTQAGTDLYAFGASSISMTDTVYVQNVKDLKEHSRLIESGRLPIERGINLSDDDRVRRDVIHGLMCNGEIRKSDIDERYGISFDDYFARELGELEPLVADGLIDLREDRILFTLLGWVFARNVGMVFDAYLRTSAHQFSRTL